MQSFKERGTKNNVVNIIRIFLIVILVIIVVYLEYQIKEIQKFKPIASLNFPEDEWIKVNDAKVYRFDDPITPNDQLFLQLNVTNKKPMRVNIEPIIQVDVGGQNPKIKRDFGLMQIGINYTGSLPAYDFFASDEGQNNLKVSLLLTNFNHTFIKIENASTNFHVLSIGDKILSEQNMMIFVGILISAAGVASASIISAIQTKITRDEKNLTQRAWVGASQNPKIESSRLLFTYTNYGHVPTNSIKPQYLISKDKIIRRDMYESNLIQVSDLGAIMPTMKQNLLIPLTEEQTGHIESGKEFYVGILIGYSYGKRKNGEYGVIYYYDHLSKSFLVSEEWTDASEKLPYIQGVRDANLDRHTGNFNLTIEEKPISSPLQRVLTEEISLSDENNDRILNPHIYQKVRIGLTIKNNQNKLQSFVYLVQTQDDQGNTEQLLSATASLAPWQFLHPSVVWIPKNLGDYFIQMFIWEKLDEPKSLALPISIRITVMPNTEN